YLSGAVKPGARTFSRQSVSMLAVFLCLSIVGAGLTGCGLRRGDPPPAEMTLRIEPDASANSGRIFYLMVRSTDEEQYLEHTYSHVASKVFGDPADPDILGVFPILPGRDEKIDVVQPRQNPVAFYFLFSEQSDDWRHLMPQPLDDTYRISIQDQSVVIEGRRSIFRRFQRY
ncbi:hypothetical protein, partial [Desulfonatronospira sp. MSAO_Bac3]|uniref:hypothetical protein n=1 Tax=Desulfonatronospira sp. MSAO_Bac3 TaxID=2293857 RepID=UPI00257AD86B